MADDETSATTTSSSGPQASGEEERCALELRAETINLVAVKRAERRGVSDRLEIGKESASDTATGHEEVNVEGNYRLEGKEIDTRASILKRTFRGRLNLRLYSDTLMLSGAVSETFAGVVTSGAGMCDVLGAAGGLRVTTSGDFRLIGGLVGMEEKLGTSVNDKVLLEIAATSCQREYGVASYKAAFVSCSGEALISMGAGTWSMLKASLGFRQQIKGQAKVKPNKDDMVPNPAVAPVAEAASGAAGGASLLAGTVPTPPVRSSSLKAATNAVGSAPHPPVRSSSLGFFKKNRVFIQDEIVPGTREAMQNSANFGEELRRVSQPPPASTFQPIDDPSPPASTLQPPEADSSYLHRTSTANGAPEGLLSTADNGTVIYRSESTATFTDDLATLFNIRYSQLNPELIDENLNLIPTPPIKKSGSLPSIDVIQPKSVSNQSIGVYELLDTATIAAKTDSTYSTPSSIQLRRRNDSLPSIPDGLEIEIPQLKAGSGAAQESTGGFGGARRATQYDASGSTSPRPRLSQEGAGWVSPSISRPNSGAYETVGFQVPSPYHSATSLNKIDSIEDLEQISDSRRSSIVSLDTEISGQQIIKNHDEQKFKLEDAANAASQKRVLSQDESITAAKLDLYRQSQEWDFHNAVTNYAKEYGIGADNSTARNQLSDYIYNMKYNDKVNADVIAEIKKIGSRKIGSRKIGSRKITPDKINKRIKVEKKKLNQLRNTLEKNKEKWRYYKKANHRGQIRTQILKIDVYENFNSKFNEFLSDPTRQGPNYSPNYDIRTFHEAAQKYVDTALNITANQKSLIDQGFAMIKKSDEPTAGFKKLISDGSYVGTEYQLGDISAAIELFQQWFTAAKIPPKENVLDILHNFIDRYTYLDLYFPSSIDKAAKVDDDIYSQPKAIVGQLTQQNSAYKSTTLTDNSYAVRLEELPVSRDPSRLSDNNAFKEAEQALLSSATDPNPNVVQKAAEEYSSQLISRAEELLRTDPSTDEIDELSKLLATISEALNNEAIPEPIKLDIIQVKQKIQTKRDGLLGNIVQAQPYRSEVPLPRNGEGFEDLEDPLFLEALTTSINRNILDQHKSFRESDRLVNPEDIYATLPISNQSSSPLASLSRGAESRPNVIKIQSPWGGEQVVPPKNLDPVVPVSVPVTSPVQLDKTNPGTLPFENPRVSVLNQTNATGDVLGGASKSVPLVDETGESRQLVNPSFNPRSKGEYADLDELTQTDSVTGLQHSDGPGFVQNIDLNKRSPRNPGDLENTPLSNSNRRTSPNNYRGSQDEDFLSIGPAKVQDATTASKTDEWTTSDNSSIFSSLSRKKKPSAKKGKKLPVVNSEAGGTRQLADAPPNEALESLARRVLPPPPQQIGDGQEASHSLRSSYESIPQQDIAASPAIQELLPTSTTSKPKRARRGILKRVGDLFGRKKSTKGLEASGVPEPKKLNRRQKKVRKEMRQRADAVVIEEKNAIESGKSNIKAEQKAGFLNEVTALEETQRFDIRKQIIDHIENGNYAEANKIVNDQKSKLTRTQNQNFNEKFFLNRIEENILRLAPPGTDPNKLDGFFKQVADLDAAEAKANLKHADSADQNLIDQPTTKKAESPYADIDEMNLIDPPVTTKKASDVEMETTLDPQTEARQKVAELVEEAKERAIAQGEGNLPEVIKEQSKLEAEYQRGDLGDWTEQQYTETVTRLKTEEDYLTHLKNGDIKAADAVLKNEEARLLDLGYELDDSESYIRMAAVHDVVKTSFTDSEDVAENLKLWLKQAGYPEDVNHRNFLIADLDAVAEPSASARSADAGDSNNNYAVLDHNFEGPKATKSDSIPAIVYTAVDTELTFNLAALRYETEFNKQLVNGVHIDYAETQKYIKTLVHKLGESFPDYLTTTRGSASFDDLSFVKNRLFSIGGLMNLE